MSMQIKLLANGPFFVYSTISALLFLLMSLMYPSEGSVVKKSVLRPATWIF